MARGGAGTGAERIDVVYLWVDGSDPHFQRQFAAYAARQAAPPAVEAAGRHRFRDNGELRYSIRALESFASWIGNVHIVTNGQVPTWLNSFHERIRLVSHDMIVPDASCLPLYNSCAIELHLHRIPGLSRRFLYMNDDIYLGRDTRRDDFLLPGGGQRFYVEPTAITRYFARGAVHDRAYLHTTKVLDRLWRMRRRAPESPAYFCARKDRVLRRRPRRRLPAHTPQLYDREILADLESLLADDFQATRTHRFRSPDDLVLRLVYLYSLLESGRYAEAVSVVLLDWESDTYYFLMLDDALPRMREKLAAIDRLRPKFFCINDDLEVASPDHPVLRYQRDFLQALFSRPGSFEKTDGPSGEVRSATERD